LRRIILDAAVARAARAACLMRGGVANKVEINEWINDRLRSTLRIIPDAPNTKIGSDAEAVYDAKSND